VAKANGKNAVKMVSVSQFGMRSDKASPAPAMIMRSGKTEIERKCIIYPQDIFVKMEKCACLDHHTPGVKTELTLSNACRKKRTIGTDPMVPFFVVISKPPLAAGNTNLLTCLPGRS
jgi:hypothetical protein